MRTTLPIDPHLPEILEKLKHHPNVVIAAAPGTGKTTRLPPACLDLFSKKVLVLEPRRLAAIGAATRIAEENGWTIGREVGWKIRFDTRVSDSTRLIFMTEALLLRQLQNESDLRSVDAVILDEFHERSAYTDLTLGLIYELQQLGHPIKIVIMSATLATDKISAYLANAPIIDLPGKTFPLDVQYQKQPLRLRTDFEFYDRVVDTLKDAVMKTQRDTLVFLPGVGEINKTREALLKTTLRDFEINVLHGSLTVEEQARVLRRSDRRRIILSTNVAESSVTIENLDLVVDTGIAKKNFYDLRTGFSRLELARISKQSAQQRAGRAARTAPGVCIRMWSQLDEHSMPESEIPEIQRVELSELTLNLAQQGITEPLGFSWFEPPPEKSLKKSQELLQSIGALTAEKNITELGEALLPIPLAPRLAALLFESSKYTLSDGTPGLNVAAALCALVQEKDFLSSYDLEGVKTQKLECDFLVRYGLMDKAPLLKKTYQQLLGLARSWPKPTQKFNGDEEVFIRTLLVKFFSDRLARRRGRTSRAVMVGGRGLTLPDTTAIDTSEFFITLDAQDLDGQSESKVRYACGLTKDFVLQNLASQIVTRKEIKFVASSQSVFNAAYRSFKDLALEEPSLTPAAAKDVQEHLSEILTQNFSEVLKNNEGLARWWARWEFFLRHNEEFEDFDFDDTVKTEVFAMAALGEKSLQDVYKKDLVYFFESRLPADIAKFLKVEVPDVLVVPSGSRMPIQYPADQDPFMEVRLQEVFGWMATPRIWRGQVPIGLSLLAPNYRPVQITKDLSSFWDNAYVEVRKELRARYPKHSWPDDPRTAPAVAKGRSIKK